MKILRYQKKYQKIWDSKIERSKNSTFLFKRGFVEYHENRFIDHSLLIFDNEKLLGCFIANEQNSKTIISHGGLTYGGLIYEKNLRTLKVKEIIVEILDYYTTKNFKEILWKVIPTFYCIYPSDEITYLLYNMKFDLFRVDQTTLIDINLRPKLNKGKKWLLSKANKEGLYVKESKKFKEFFNLYNPHLKIKYGVNPVHTSDELMLLNSRFPDNIKLISAFINDLFIGGIVGFITNTVFHAQYIHFSDQGKQFGGPDLVIDYIINNLSLRFFDFGISTENDGKYLNEGLLNFKESYGGRGAVHLFFKKTL